MNFNQNKIENYNDGKIQTLLLQVMRKKRRTVIKDIKRKKKMVKTLNRKVKEWCDKAVMTEEMVY